MKRVFLPAIFLFAVAVPACFSAVSLEAPAKTVHLDIALPPPGSLPWVVFDEKSGLPQHTIVDLMTDQQGFVWAATQDGAARYDGRKWTAVSLPRAVGNFPRAMRRAKDGGIWFGSFDGGLAHLRDGKWTITDTSSGLPSNRVRGLLETTGDRGDTILWMATDHGVARLHNGHLTTFDEKLGLPSLDTEALYETALLSGKRELVVGTANGLARFDGSRFVPVPVPAQILGARIDDIVESTGLDGGPALWIASYGHGMAVLENGAWTILDTASGLPSNVEVFTKSTAADGSPALWIGSEGGLLRFEHGRFTLYDERCGMPVQTIWKVLETTSPGGLKTLWLGTWGGGIERLSPNYWMGFDRSIGMPSGSVTSVAVSQDENGADTIWAGTSDGQLARFENGQFHTVSLPEELRHAIIFSLRVTTDPDGGRSLWVGSFGGGLGQLKDGQWKIYGPDVLQNGRVYTVVETKATDGHSILWVGTEGGLARLEQGKWTLFKPGVELPSEIVTRVLETVRADGTHTMWVGTSRGLARFENGQWSVLSRQKGRPSDNILALDLIVDADGTKWVWAGTTSGGAFRFRLEDPSGEWETFTTTTTPALPTDAVRSISQDHQHRIYIATTRGVLRLTPRTPTAEDPSRFSEDLFTSDDGLPSGDCQEGAHFVDQRGRIWVGTAHGLAMYDPALEIPDLRPKPLVLESAGLSNMQRALHEGDALSYFERNLTFEYALLSYQGESRIRYRYQLLGFDPQPSAWSASSSKEYTNLGAGDYTFQIWGRDARGNVSGPVSLDFRIKPAPWLTPWAFAFYAIASIGIVLGSIQWRVRVLSRRTKQLEAAVAERTRELTAARDQLEQLASVDALTGLANRRRFDTVLDDEWKRAQRNRHWLTLALLDVDYFKRYNDRYGHAAGDRCLRAVAQAVASQCRRTSDLAARYGGEEFALVLPETDPEGVSSLLRSILAAVDALQIEHAGSDCAPHVTVSIGAVSLKPPIDSPTAATMREVDELLYRSKENGRHQATHGVESKSPQKIHAVPEDASHQNSGNTV